MTADQPTDHRAEAEKWLDIASRARDKANADLDDPEADMFAGALIGIGHWLGAIHRELVELSIVDAEILDEDEPT